MTTPRSWKLVGRAPELRRIGAARAEGLVGVAIHGPPGYGKSRLVREALGEAEEEGAAVAWVQATRSAAAVPLGAFASVIPPTARSDDPLELMQRAVVALRESAEGRPLVLALDDAQWLDPPSAALALQLASTGTAFLVVSVRSGERCPDAIVSLWKDAGALRLELGPLDAAETEEMVAALLGGDVERSVGRWVYEAGAGNALYIRELIHGALDDGALREVDGLWRMSARPAAGESLTDLIDGRIGELGDEERRAIGLLALGEPLRLSELVALTRPAALEALEDRGLVAVAAASSDAEVRLAHPLYGAAVIARMPVLRGRELRLALVETVGARAELEPEDTVRLARWLSEADEPIPTGLLIRAARAAGEAGDPGFGAVLAEQALAAGAGIEAALLLARAHSVRNRFEQAEAVLAEAEPTIQSQADAIAYLEQQRDVLHWGLGRTAELRAVLDRAAGWWTDREWQAQLEPLHVLLGHFEEFRTDNPGGAGADDPDAQVRELASLFYSGRTRAAHELALRIRPTPPVRGVPDALALVLWNRIALEDGEGWEELDTWMGAALETTVRLDDHATAGHAAYSLACLRTLAGRYLDAAALLAEAEAQLERQDPVAMLVVVHAQQVLVAVARGDREGATAALGRCLERVGDSGPLVHQLPSVVRAEAWSAHLDGEHQRAQERLLEVARELEQRPVQAAQLTYEAMRAGADAGGAASALSALAERCDARLVAAYAAHAAGRAAGDGPALLASAEEMAAIGALRYGAEAAAHAAEAFLDEGRQDSARRAAARSKELFAADQDGTRPPIEGLDRTATDLTQRESELVALASRGLTNAEIAERLVLSVRTVESHLYRAMRKLGVSDRRELRGVGDIA
ncbi:MAG TPA: LuxR C-terminal-related transcriptional regulator [Solirubrobacterales bacterium]|nr:LuxR C-terminal-related transcriptional regulator [Solirubrobacterales bacterium]